MLMDEFAHGEEEIFERARFLSDRAELRTFLEEVCAGNRPRFERLSRLLLAGEEADEFFEEGTAALKGVLQVLKPAEGIGDWVGRYKLIEKLGEGGCGVVYMAEQLEPLRRRVALKIIKLGMDTRSVVARFEAERQALAMMEHPNIARVLDAGATASGGPFFVMELVQGTRITAYCEQNQLTIPSRLELFIQVCQAVQHAHQKGIIHRDIKPSNILVTLNAGMPIPKVIDFGIAKAIEGRLTEDTLLTVLPQFLGTPAYMSPEQVLLASAGVDTRSDIYSLGVLLYELLTGATPFETRALLAKGVDEFRRILRETEPVRPSVRLLQRNSTGGGPLAVGVNSRVFREKQRLAQSLRGDLDWIVLKCLEKDRGRRYQSVSDLISDIQHHLSNKPVLAGPPSASYRLRKFLRRNRLAVVSSVALVGIILLAAVVSTREALRAKRAEHLQSLLKAEAERQAARALQAEASMAEKLRASYLTEATALRSSHSPGRRFHALDLLAKAAAIRPSIELRNAAIASMALSDIELTREIDTRPDFVGAVRTDPSCRFYALSDRDSNIFVRRIDNNEEVAFLPAQNSKQVWLGFSRDGRFLATLYDVLDGSVELIAWEFPGTKIVLKENVGRVGSFAFFPDGRLAYASGFGPLQVFTLGGGMSETISEAGPVSVVAIDASGTKLALATTGQNVVRILDFPSRTLLKSFVQPDVINMVWDGSGDRLACAAEDHQVYIWDTEHSKVVAKLVGHQSRPITLSFSHSGELLASTGWDGMLRLWNAHTGTEILHRPAFSYGAWFDPADEWLYSQSSEGKLGAFRLAQGHECRTLRFTDGMMSESWSCAFSPDGRLLVSPHQSGIRFWDAERGRLIAFCQIGNTRTVRFDSSGEYVVTNGEDGLRRWRTSELLARHGSAPFAATHEDFDWHSQFSPITAMDKSGRLVASVRDGAACIYDLRARTETACFTGDTAFEYAAISNSGKWCATGHWKSALGIYEIETKQLLTNLPVSASSASFSPNEAWLAVPGYQEYSLWRTRSWTLVWSLPRAGSGYYIRGVLAFSGDGRTLAVSQGALVSLRDTATGEELATLEAPEEANISALAFNPDSTKLAVCKWNQTIDLWDLHQIRWNLRKMKLDWP